MSCKIKVTSDFLRDLKKLAKRYPSIKHDIEKLGEEVQANPLLGTDLGGGFHKIRVAITSKGRGKSGGARVITFVVLAATIDTEVTFLTIYDKSDRSNIPVQALHDIAKRNGLY